MTPKNVSVRLSQTLILGLVSLVIGFPTFAQSNNNATQSRTWNGTIAITTSSDGLWTFITIASPAENKPLQAAFVVQHLPPVPPGLNVTIDGQAELLSRAQQPPGVALRVTAKRGRCSFFRLADYKGDVPPACQTIDLAGIARYESTPTHDSLPASHEEFVNQVLPVLEKNGPHLSPGGQSLDDCTICGSGGAGSSQCSSAMEGGPSSKDCSVTCVSGYYSCCDSSCVCCKPSLSPTGSLLNSPIDSLTRAAQKLGYKGSLPHAHNVHRQPMEIKQTSLKSKIQTGKLGHGFGIQEAVPTITSVLAAQGEMA